MAESSNSPALIPEVNPQKPREGSAATFSFTSDCTGGGDVSDATEDVPVCWICLDPASLHRPLSLPCKCPRYCHQVCLARWQLQSAGTRRETHCEFCDGVLPDWRKMLTPDCGANAPAIMNVNFDGRTYSFEVRPGASGYLQFTEAIRHAFQLPSDSELNITFTCDEPCSSRENQVLQSPEPQMTAGGNLLTLQGPGAYDAAVYCASVSAARRQMQSRHTHRHASSPNLDTSLDSNDPASQEDRTDLTDPTRQLLRPEEFISRAHSQNLGESSTRGSSPAMQMEDGQRDRGRRRSWSRVGSRLKAFFRFKR